MQPHYTPEAEAYREKVQAFLAEHLPADWKGTGALEGDALEQFIVEWRHTLYENGMLALNWPKEVGGAGLSSLESVIVAEEFAKAGVPSGGPNDVFGIQMVGNTILQWGTDEQKAHFLPRILSAEDKWCQGYSEPDAGSVALGFGEPFFAAAQAELDASARLDFSAGAVIRPAGLGDRGPLSGAGAVGWRALGRDVLRK